MVGKELPPAAMNDRKTSNCPDKAIDFGESIVKPKETKKKGSQGRRERQFGGGRGKETEGKRQNKNRPRTREKRN